MRMNSELDAQREAAAEQRRQAALRTAHPTPQVAAPSFPDAAASEPSTPPRSRAAATAVATPLSPSVRAAAAASATKRSGNRGGASAPRRGDATGTPRSTPGSRIPVARTQRGRDTSPIEAPSATPASASSRSQRRGSSTPRVNERTQGDDDHAAGLGLEAKVRYQRARLTVLADERDHAIAEKREALKEATTLRQQMHEFEQERVKLQRAAQAAETEAKREKKRQYAVVWCEPCCAAVPYPSRPRGVAQAKVDSLQAQLTAMRKDLDKQQREARSANSDAHARDARLQRALADVRGSLWQSPAMWG